jgi:hypothetical protein
VLQHQIPDAPIASISHGHCRKLDYEFDLPKARNVYRALLFSTVAVMISATVAMPDMVMICLGRSFSKSDEKLQTRTITRATMSAIRLVLLPS